MEKALLTVGWKNICFCPWVPVPGSGSGSGAEGGKKGQWRCNQSVPVPPLLQVTDAESKIDLLLLQLVLPPLPYHINSPPVATIFLLLQVLLPSCSSGEGEPAAEAERCRCLSASTATSPFPWQLCWQRGDGSLLPLIPLTPAIPYLPSMLPILATDLGWAHKLNCRLSQTKKSFL